MFNKKIILPVIYYTLFFLSFLCISIRSSHLPFVAPAVRALLRRATAYTLIPMAFVPPEAGLKSKPIGIPRVATKERCLSLEIRTRCFRELPLNQTRTLTWVEERTFYTAMIENQFLDV